VLRHRYAEHIGAPLDSVTGEMIFDRYDAGDPVCQRLVAEFFNGLGHGLYNLVNIFDPQTIFIGGGVVERPDFWRCCASIWPGSALPTISIPSVTATMPA
jgi:beta-glucoside kinase